MEKLLNIMENTKLKIDKISTYIPKKIINNNFLDKKFLMKKGFFYRATGIKYRRIANKKETTEFMALEAVKKVLKKKKFNFSSIISVTNTPSIFFPSLSHQVYSKFYKQIGKQTSCIGLNSGCSGYVDALNLATKILNTKKKQKILIVTSDNYSKNLDKEDRSTTPLFSDGATATIVSNYKGSYNVIKEYSQTVPNTIKDLLFAKIKNKYVIKMNGPDVFVFAVNYVLPVLKKILNKKEKITIFFHQASKIVLEKINSSIKKNNYNLIIPSNLKNFGNTVSSSIPILISQNWNIFKKSKNILLVGFGVGLTLSLIKLKKN